MYSLGLASIDRIWASEVFSVAPGILPITFEALFDSFAFFIVYRIISIVSFIHSA